MEEHIHIHHICLLYILVVTLLTTMSFSLAIFTKSGRETSRAYTYLKSNIEGFMEKSTVCLVGCSTANCQWPRNAIFVRKVTRLVEQRTKNIGVRENHIVNTIQMRRRYRKMSKK